VLDDGGDAAHANGPFDLCIVDTPLLVRRKAYLALQRRAFDPLFLPILLLADRREIDRIPPEIASLADDVLLRPVERYELAARVQSLLRTRRLSLRAQRLSGLYEQEALIAQRLQRAALPHEFPHVPGLAFDGYYHPADRRATIGGDWYDVMRIADGRVVVTIGDVVGSGLEAAVTMSKLRQVVRGIAHVHPSPALILEAADRTLSTDEPGRYATVFVAVLDVVAEEFTYASAGHPPPLVQATDGSLEPLATGGLLLGTGMRERRRTFSARLPAGASIIFYTDGLIEATRDVDAGEARLRHVLADRPTTARDVYAGVIEAETADDIAVLLVRRDGTSDAAHVLRETFDAADAVAARRVRGELTTALLAHGAHERTVYAAEVILAELLGNCVRYAPGTVQVALDLSGAAAVLHVIDDGPGFRHAPRLPQELTCEGGRGLYIVHELAEEFTVERAPGGGSHARVVL